ncbi:UDP-glucuronosyltransferase 1-1 [Chionoecetes opilio]|uniref:UDP-glucuronosyltransferase 1-1 n=1 Tax=Chionoecetes opilio TaxID=41210 RepID=A0A8J4XWK2_CHIOP|nr:UDP-glucuronosyltransferase 1-1 [Chionoecetes opilio]
MSVDCGPHACQRKSRRWAWQHRRGGGEAVGVAATEEAVNEAVVVTGGVGEAGARAGRSVEEGRSDSRLRLFITHGGLLSTLESMYHGVSVLGMPVFADQHTNMMEVEQNGWGKVLHWSELTPETLRQKISEVINDKSLREEAQRRSVVMRDQAQRPEDVAVFWVEYVLRHHGAPHLVSPVRSMPWYQLYNVDIWVTLLVVDLLIIYALYKVLRALCRCIFSNKTKQKSE